MFRLARDRRIVVAAAVGAAALLTAAAVMLAGHGQRPTVATASRGRSSPAISSDTHSSSSSDTNSSSPRGPSLGPSTSPSPAAAASPLPVPAVSKLAPLPPPPTHAGGPSERTTYSFTLPEGDVGAEEFDRGFYLVLHRNDCAGAQQALDYGWSSMIYSRNVLLYQAGVEFCRGHNADARLWFDRAASYGWGDMMPITALPRTSCEIYKSAESVLRQQSRASFTCDNTDPKPPHVDPRIDPRSPWRSEQPSPSPSH